VVNQPRPLIPCLRQIFIHFVIYPIVSRYRHYERARKELVGLRAQARLFQGREVRTVFDVGSNKGDMLARYTSLFPSATIYGFEPTPGLYRALQQRFVAFKTVILLQKAVSEVNGTSAFYQSAQNADMNSLLAPGKHNWMEEVTTSEVDCITLDSFCEQHGIQQIDILKLDIQGGEFSALRGAANLLAQHKIECIYFEHVFYELYGNQPSLGKLVSWLEDHGYSLFNFYDAHYITQTQQLAWCDLLFISPELQAKLSQNEGLTAAT
jgi:FkbM family methyltransferase